MRRPSSGWRWRCCTPPTCSLWTPTVRASGGEGCHRAGRGWRPGALTAVSPGLSDPFVIVELGPPHLFPLVRSQRTQVKSRTLHPVYDELFYL